MIQLLEMIEVAKRAAIEAGDIALHFQESVAEILEKGQDPTNISTEADIKSEKAILSLLRKKFPRHSFFSEEEGKKTGQAKYVWVIDPIDGSIPYSAGLPLYGISIGLLKNNKPLLGVINLPSLNKLYWAVEGKGAYLNGRKVVVSKQPNLSRSIVGFDFAYAKYRKNETKELLLPLVSKVRYPPILASTSVALCFVAEGIYDAYLHTAHLWDYVAGAAIVQEAGGKVTDYIGGPIDWSQEWIEVIVSNGLIHQQVLKTIKK